MGLQPVPGQGIESHKLGKPGSNFFFPFVEKYFFVCRSRATASYVLIVRSFDDGLTKISQMCELIKAGSWGNHKATAKAQRIK